MRIFHKILIPSATLLVMLLSIMIYAGYVFYDEGKTLDTSLQKLKDTEVKLTAVGEGQHSIEFAVLSYRSYPDQAFLNDLNNAERKIDSALLNLRQILTSLRGRRLLSNYIEERYSEKSIRNEFLAMVDAGDPGRIDAAYSRWSVKLEQMHAVLDDIVIFNISQIEQTLSQFSESRAMFSNVVIGIFFLAVSLLVISYFLYRRLVIAPINALEDMAHSYAHGEFTIKVPDILLDEAGDFYSLSKSFLNMAKELDETTVSRDEAQDMARKLEEARHRIEGKARQHIAVSEALSVARDEAETANKAKSEFLASMSHEIRTPMTGVMGLADMLLEEDLDEDSRHKVFKIKDSTRSLMRIINDILDMSKMEAGKMELENIDFHLPSLIRETIDLFSEKRRDKRQKNIHFEALFEDNFPAGIKCDPIRIRQILVNLIGNSVKFTREGTITVEGRVVQAPTGIRMLRIAVRDTGIGIRPGTIPKLFSDFTQADATITRHFEGTGLGLAICKRLVELMDGEIGVESKFGEGSTFWFTLPFIPATSEVREKISDSLHRGSSFKAIRSLRILVAEDNNLNQQIIMSLMRNLGHETTIAQNGAEATEKHLQHEYDLILMDVRMPIMSGPDATQTIRQMSGMKAYVPIIALTADAMEENKQGYFDVGMNEVVTKPIDKTELVQAIDKVIGEAIHIPLSEEEQADKREMRKKAKGAASLEDVEQDLENLLSDIGTIGEEDESSPEGQKIIRLRN